MGITHPSAKGQEQVVRMAYQKANLDPNLTAYAELHGTGTPVGDPIEVRAISRALNDRRPEDRPLLVGAVKPNIGHSEAASGIFAVMKAALMTESSIIPGVAYFQNLNPAIKEKEWNVKIHANTAAWPTDFPVRRTSVSSFGYGGTNGHVIIESIDSLYPWYRHAGKKQKTNSPPSDRAFLLCLSAHDKPTLLRNVAAVGAVANNYNLTDLAYTLNLRRTKFAHRTYVVAREGREAESFALATSQAGTAAKKIGSIGFFFTGQGAQWVGMGRLALQEFPVVMDTIQHLDRILSKVHPKPSFSLVEMLLGNNEDNAKRINDADVAQPLSTAIQIAIVDLFAQWNITPEVSIGHSSGEIAAAYAAGLISAPEAILVAFCRGRAVTACSSSGSMLAVGLGADEVGKYLSSFAAEDVCIACENSPSSITLSGRQKPISQLKDMLTEERIFARELPTGRAYHSPHMAPVCDVYDCMLAEALDEVSEDDLLWRRQRSGMISSVTGEIVDCSSESLLPGYWSANLRNRVLFNTAVQHLGTNSEFESITHMIEIGPHSALAGPFKQIRLSNKNIGNRITYVSSLKRLENDADGLLRVAGSLFVAGHAVDLEAVNMANDGGIKNDAGKQKTKQLLVDLPPYQWNYEKRYWAEPRASAEQRARVYPRHDLLGSRVSGLSKKSASWRNVLRQRDVPWLKDHNLGGTVIFPAAGHLSMAIEALRQVCEIAGDSFGGVKLRDVDIKTALVVPEDDEGVEVILNLQAPTDASSKWYTFSVESPGEDGEWTVHCKGRISAVGELESPPSNARVPVDESALTQRVSGRRWYDAFHRVGFYYGKNFQGLRHARTARTLHHATGDVTVRECCAEEMQGESRYLVHPSSIDACLQLIIISINAGKHKEMPHGVVPIHFEEVTLFPARLGEETDVGHAIAWTDGFEGRRFNTNVQLTGGDDRLLLDIKSMICTAYEAALPAKSESMGGEEGKGPEPFSIMAWKPDIGTLRPGDADLLWPNISNYEKLAKCVDLIAHRDGLSNVLIIAQTPSRAACELVDALIRMIPSNTTVTIGFGADGDEQNIPISDSVMPRVQKITLGLDPENWATTNDGSHDLVVVTSNVETSEISLYESLSGLVGNAGWLVCPSINLPSCSLSPLSLRIGEYSLLQKTSVNVPENDLQQHFDTRDEITILSSCQDQSAQSVTKILSGTRSRYTVSEKVISELPEGFDHPVIVNDLSGAVSASLLESEKHFEAVKKLFSSEAPILWITRGVRQGRPGNHSVAGGMTEGLLRVIRSEQAAVKVTLLDIDFGEEPCDVSRAITHALSSTATKDPGCETEFWLHRSIMFTSRVHAHDELNRELGQNQPQMMPLSGALKLANKTAEGQFIFEPQGLVEQNALGEDEIEIQVAASSWPSYSANSRMVVLGSVIRTGESVWRDLLGKRVLAFAFDGLQTVFTTSVYTVIDDEFDESFHDSLLHTVSSLCPLIHMCLGNAKMERGDTVISLPGPEQDIRMLGNLSRAMGWQLTVVTQDEGDAELYATRIGLSANQILRTNDADVMNAFIQNQRTMSSSRVVTILAHDFGARLAQEAWRHIPPSCRFLVLDEKPLETALDPIPFSRGASFMPSSMRHVRESAKAASTLLATSLNLIKEHSSILGVETAQGINCVDIEDARDITAKNVGKDQGISNVVVRYRSQASRVLIVPKSKQLRLSSDATYLLVGCLGGLGRSLTRWMMEHGARHFAFISRSGVDKPEAARLVADIQLSGASTQVLRADASDEESIAQLVISLHAQRPIRGVVHAAMVLKDGMFEQMTHRSFAECVKPKAQGALSLHRALQVANIDPDFFVMTSSISALLGNTGQANYSAANSALDSLARQRRTAGLAATSLVLPMVLDVGVVADNDAIEASLVRKGLYGIDEHEMLRGFAAAMMASRSSPSQRMGSNGGDLDNLRSTFTDDSQIIMGMEPRELAASAVGESADAYWHGDSRFRHTRAVMDKLLRGDGSHGSSNKEGNGENNTFARSIKAALSESHEALVKVISEHIARRMSSILMIPCENFELNGSASIASYGLDSMIGAELRTWLFKEFGLDYPFQKLLASTLTFEKLSGAVVDKMGLLATAN
ncbi:putative polyketide [Rosellinia necatrix]|uniref:Putative polyketide n=1 Tax=Rosellinia necatrix TaxID=77044 RepID=A0A1S8AAG4_ROSNE|nr:putative polyketide [Rosellinia necatrix]